MKAIAFYKMSGCGNDFIIIDNRSKSLSVSDYPQLARKLCHRRLSLGADGMIYLEPSASADFKWRFYNSDGSVAEMCGNGARCVARFAYLNGITGSPLSFETDAGIVAAEVVEDRIKIRMTDATGFRTDETLMVSDGNIQYDAVNTGVPHVVIHVDDVNSVDVAGQGREIRYHDTFKPAGTNVNFVSSSEDEGFAIRTYERGVEGETLACGTGCVAAALILGAKMELKSPIDLKTRSGNRLRIYFNRIADGFDQIFLEGDARIICSGQLHSDAWEYDLPEGL